MAATTVNDNEHPQLCEALERNDPEERHASVSMVNGNGMNHRMIRALESNTVVSSIDIDVAPLTLDDTLTENKESTGRLLGYVRTSQSLKNVRLSGWDQQDGENEAKSELYMALGANDSVKWLVLENASPFGLEHLLRSSRSISDMFVSLDDENAEQLLQSVEPDAWSTNTSLKTIFLSSNDMESMGSILTGLGSHPCLEELTISFRSSIPSPSRFQSSLLDAGLNHFLQTTSVVPTLIFHMTIFNRSAMEAVLQALTLNHSITQLVFEDCKFNGDATELLVLHAQNDCNEYVLDFRGCTFRATTPEDVRTRLLGAPSLKGLGWSSWRPNEGCGWISALRKSSTIRLPLLQVSLASRADMPIVIATMPELIHLRELRIKSSLHYPLTDENSAQVLAALRKNGSLHKLTVITDTDESFFNGNEVRLADAFGQRNEHLPKLLARKPDVANTRFVPALIVAAHPVELFAPNNVLKGLLSLSGIANHRNDSKRKVGD